MIGVQTQNKENKCATAQPSNTEPQEELHCRGPAQKDRVEAYSVVQGPSSSALRSGVVTILYKAGITKAQALRVCSTQEVTGIGDDCTGSLLVEFEVLALNWDLVKDGLLALSS